MTNRFQALAASLRSAETPDRRLDSEVTVLALAPTKAQLDAVAGIDGWDIVTPSDAEEEPDVWMEADDVLYATRFVDSAIELCAQASPAAPMIITRALANALRRNTPVADAADLAGVIARHILAELMDELYVSARQAGSMAA